MLVYKDPILNFGRTLSRDCVGVKLRVDLFRVLPPLCLVTCRPVRCDEVKTHELKKR